MILNFGLGRDPTSRSALSHAQCSCHWQVHHAALAHKAGFTTLSRTVSDGAIGEDGQSIADATAIGSRVNYGGVGIGSDGERVRCLALDDFQLRNVSLLKIDAVRINAQLSSRVLDPPHMCMDSECPEGS